MKKRSNYKNSSCGCHSHNGFQLESFSLEGLAQRKVDLNGGVDRDPDSLYIDTEGSVSALVEGEGFYADVPELLIEEQYRRFLNGF